MNLSFKKVDEIEKDGSIFAVHRAVVGNNPVFWWKWRNVENKEELHDRSVLAKEKGEWVIYRLTWEIWKKLNEFIV